MNEQKRSVAVCAEQKLGDLDLIGRGWKTRSAPSGQEEPISTNVGHSQAKTRTRTASMSVINM